MRLYEGAVQTLRLAIRSLYEKGEQERDTPRGLLFCSAI